MVIHINPNRINGPAAGRPRPQKERESKREESVVAKQPRAEENFIPEPESLATMIRGAISALRSGIHWDRGTILNLLV
jgi:hypothetical protein